MEMKGKVAVVTGSGGAGCGRAVAQRLAREGAGVVVSDIDEPGGHETVRLVEAQGGRAVFFSADVGVEADIRALIAFAEKTYGGADILVNNAGPYFGEAPMEHQYETAQANLFGTLYGTFCALEALGRRGDGAIVNFGSTSALGHGRKHSNSPAYDAAKAAVIRLTTCLGPLREKGIRVNCLVPHWVATEEVTSAIAAMTPEERREAEVPAVLITLDEIADAALQLASDQTLAGRVMVLWGGQLPRFIPDGDPGYAALE